jgi:flagellar hook-length control protein FliK
MNLIIDYRWLGIMPTARTTEEPAAKAKKPKKRAAGQREMLLPIASKGTVKEAAKEKAKEPARLQLVSGKLALCFGRLTPSGERVPAFLLTGG